jgi:hypothetical protein
VETNNDPSSSWRPVGRVAGHLSVREVSMQRVVRVAVATALRVVVVNELSRMLHSEVELCDFARIVAKRRLILP